MDASKFRVKHVSRNPGDPGRPRDHSSSISPLLMPRYSGKEYAPKPTFSVLKAKFLFFLVAGFLTEQL
ncbi:hypothetical protein N7463_003772 [Penicillium fimorum]|uniref:Uncharacterized protein n=1 Tax=Penicillium fimorum TaxID=1882269 RepID=A0A9X0CA91_9EURO|nr:hypothetical protein N7463_003772 [Penicillium fimorum]